jgi:hypothetical protein
VQASPRFSTVAFIAGRYQIVESVVTSIHHADNVIDNEFYAFLSSLSAAVPATETVPSKYRPPE